ncbi:L-fuculokinase [Muribacter muris]|uniref:L-fuculokinase n=1 Tax=Muribacter muris TaxID=67855 RepID=A0A4Y9JXS4_9PAST|nr:L-fuculokinase [Muribacter muris]MBF0785486.1 L-fuculokinase [Muribacter muris]MBF0826584.1 L-fuculokinase [Muribacter muris]TFV09216.1 L-fuculokinase [Muribacter muris]
MPIALIFDCGATNLRTIAINEQGQLLAASHQPNTTLKDAQHPDFQLWHFAEIWQKLTACAEKTLADLTVKGFDRRDIVGIGVTTFGVDGTLFDRNGQPLYPIISWKCPRTLPIMAKFADYLDPQMFYRRNGIGMYSFNTLFKLLWLKEHCPSVYAEATQFVFISSMLNRQLTGNLTTDHTMAGTSMMTELATGDWDSEVLELLGWAHGHFPPVKHAGEPVGQLLPALAERFGIGCVPVISCGHDTQFAVFGSGAGINQPVLSSGTWEILMARTTVATPESRYLAAGLTTEFDAVGGLFNPAVQWLGSGVLEWVGKQFFADQIGSKAFYATMIAEAQQAQAGANGVLFRGDFDSSANGTISGLSLCQPRGNIYRAALEYMALRLKAGLEVLQQVGQFEAESLLCVGGGSKNRLWNQIRADMLNRPIDVVNMAETTVLGAAMFTLSGVGVFSDVAEAQQVMKPQTERVFPSGNRTFYAEWANAHPLSFKR